MANGAVAILKREIRFFFNLKEGRGGWGLLHSR